MTKKCTASQLECAKCKIICNEQCYYHIDNIKYLNKQIVKEHKKEDIFKTLGEIIRPKI